MQKKSENPAEETTSIGKELRSWLLTLGIAVLLAFAIGRFVIMNSSVPTGSMIPTISEHSRVIANRLSYLTESPERGDIVIFKFPDDESVYYVKRVIGLPGETVTIRDGPGVYQRFRYPAFRGLSGGRTLCAGFWSL